MGEWPVPEGLIYASEVLLSGDADILPEGEFLLPICTTRERLGKILTVLWEGRENLPQVDGDPLSGANVDNIDYLNDILQALAFINDPENAGCYAPEIGDGNDCTMFLPETGFIEYAPNDPFQTPLFTPGGYLLPPWYTNPGIPLPGVIPTDAMVNFLSFPVFADMGEAAESGLPRFHFDFIGTGEVEIEFVKVVQGGLVRVVVDGDELQQDLINLNTQGVGDVTPIEAIFDIVIGESLVQTYVLEKSFSTPGLHTIDATFFPNVGTDIILGMGGGLRRVSFCGVSIEPEESEVPQFQVDDCVLQWRPNSDAPWVDLVDLCAVQPPTIVRQDQTPPGNLEQNIGGAGFTEIADTDFFYRDARYPMTNSYEAIRTIAGTSTQLRTLQTVSLKADGHTINSGLILNRRTYTGSTPSDMMQEQHYWIDPPGSANPSSILRYAMHYAGQFYPVLQLYAGGDRAVSIVPRSGQPSALLINPAGTLTGYAFRIMGAAGAWTAFDVAPDGATTIRMRKGFNNLVFDGLLLDQDNTGTPAAGFGTALRIVGKSSTTQAQNMARLASLWFVATHSVRQADMVAYVSDWAGEREAVRYRASGAAAMIGEYGHAPAAQQIVVGDTYGIPALNSLLGALAATGRIVNSTTSLATPPPWATAFNVTGDKFGNEALASLITGLDTANVINDLTSDTGAYEYLPPPPIDVEGNWQGLEVGKALALALNENDYIVDLTELGARLPTDIGDLSLRCRAAAAADWIVYEWYIASGLYAAMVQPSSYDPPLYDVFTRWGDATNLVESPMEHHFDDLYDGWFTQIWGSIYDGLSDDNWNAHVADMIAYLPTIEEAFYCGANDEGIIDANGLVKIQTLLFAGNYTGAVPDDIQTWFYAFFQYFSAQEMGFAVANAIFSNYTTAVDCGAFGDCGGTIPDWCKQYNFTLGTYTPPFDIVSGDHVFGATFNPGWKTDDTGILRIEFPFPTIEVTIKYNVTIPDDAYVVLFGSLDGGFEANLTVAGGNYEETIVIPEAFRALGWYFRAACNPVNTVVTIKNVTNMTGTGIEPTDLNDC